MKTLFLVFTLFASLAAQVSAQSNPFDPYAPVTDDLASPNPMKCKYRILLGPDRPRGQAPFIDAYTLQAALRAGGITVSLEDIEMDFTSPLPKTNGITLRVLAPKGTEEEAEQLRKRYLERALRFGITELDLQFSPDQKQVEGQLLVGYPGPPTAGHDWNKLVTAAYDLCDKNPVIALFHDTRQATTSAGLPGTMSMGGMGGMGGGMGGMGTFVPSVLWAPESGYVQDGKLLVSWSTKDRVVAVLGSSGSGAWVRVTLPGERMTRPVLGSGMCVFICENEAFGYSQTTNRWSRKTFDKDTSDPIAQFDGNLITLQVKGDLLVFTQAGNWLSRKEATKLPHTSAGMSGMEMYGGMGSGMEMDMGSGMEMDMGSGMGMGMGSGMGMGMGSGMATMSGGAGMMMDPMDNYGSAMGGMVVTASSESETELRERVAHFQAQAESLEQQQEALVLSMKSTQQSLDTEAGKELRSLAKQWIEVQNEIRSAELGMIVYRLAKIQEELQRRRGSIEKQADARAALLLGQ